MPALKNNAENPEEVGISPEPRKRANQQGEIISPERNPFKRNRFGIRPEPEIDNGTFSDSYKDPYRGLETANPLSKNER